MKLFTKTMQVRNRRLVDQHHQTTFVSNMRQALRHKGEYCRRIFNAVAILAFLTLQVFPSSQIVLAAAHENPPLAEACDRNESSAACLAGLASDPSESIDQQQYSDPYFEIDALTEEIIAKDEHSLSTELLPAWMGSVNNNFNQPESIQKQTAISEDFLPDWMQSMDSNVDQPEIAQIQDTINEDILPSWMAEPIQQQATPLKQPQGSKPPATKETMLPLRGPYSPGEGVCPSADELSIKLIPPPYAVSQGNPNGDTYVVTITNNSETTMPELSLLITPGVGFYYLGDSASAASNISGTLSYTDTGTAIPGDPSVITLTGVVTELMALEPGELITFSFKLATTGDATSGQALQVDIRSGDTPAPDTCISTSENITTVRGDLEVFKSPQNQAAALGDVVTWTITAKNTGEGTVYGAIITDTFGGSFIDTDDSDLPSSIDIAPGFEFPYIVTATVDSCTDLTNTALASWDPGNLDGTGTITNPVVSEADIDYNTYCSADLLDMQLTLPPYPISRGNTAGDTYTVTITNNASSCSTYFDFQIDPSAGFYYLADSAALESSLAGSVSYTDSGQGSPGGTSTITPTGSPTMTALLPGETVTLNFRLATNEDAISSQPLLVNFRSGSPTPTTCQFAQENVRTVRGNLIILKSPDLQQAEYGDVISWTVFLRNTGLGTVYSATASDEIGAGYTNVDFSQIPSEPITLTVGSEISFPITATVASCENLTNTARAYWNIGNQDGTGTSTNPVDDQVDIIYQLEKPSLAYERYPSEIEVLYCDPLSETILITITNSGGPIKDFYFTTTNLDSLSISNLSSDWTYSNGTFTYTGGIPAGSIYSDAPVVLSFDIDSNKACSPSELDNLEFEPHFKDPCGTPCPGGADFDIEVNAAPDQPQLEINKTGPSTIFTGESFEFTATLNASNIENITDTITVTDNVDAAFIINDVDATAGSVNTSAGLITWTLDTPGSGDIEETLTISVTARDDGECAANKPVTNLIQANALGCPDCPSLSDQAEHTVYIQDSSGSLQYTKSITGSAEICGVPGLTIENIISFDTPITWTNTTFTDSLGIADLPSPLLYQSESLSVILDGVDRTSDVTITQSSPRLILDLSAMGTVSNTADLTITYQLTIPAASLGGTSDTNRSFFSWSEIQMGGVEGGSCLDNNTFYFGNFINLARSDLDLRISTAAPNACQTTPVTLSVDTLAPQYVADHLMLTMTLGSKDVYTITGYGGGFTLHPPSIVISNGQNITWTWSTSEMITNTGEIYLDVLRPCGEEEALQAHLDYKDNCAIDLEDNANQPYTPNEPDLHLFKTPDQYVVKNKQAVWRYYVTNLGTGPAYNAVVTNTIPSGHQVVSTTFSSSTGDPVDVLTTTGTLPSGEPYIRWVFSEIGFTERIQVDVYDQIVDACNLPSSVTTTLSVGCLDQECSSDGPQVIRLLPTQHSILSSNNQVLNLPLCETGPIDLYVKNTSAVGTEYSFVITDVLTALEFIADSAIITVTNKNGQVITSTHEFQPQITIDGDETTLVWDNDDLSVDSHLRSILDERAAEDVIQIRFTIKTSCDSSANNAIQSAVLAYDACSRFLSTTEGAVTLKTSDPELTLSKQVRNLSEGFDYDDSVLAGVGDSLSWKMIVENVGEQRVTNFFLQDQLPGDFNITSVNPITSSQSGNLLFWHEGGGTILDPATVVTYTITGTVGSNACSLDTSNIVTASFGCSTGDVCSTESITASASIDTKPVFTLDIDDLTLNPCGGGPVVINFANSGARAQNMVISYTLPTGLVYNGLATGTDPTPNISPTIGASGTITFSYASVDSGITDGILKFNLSSDPNGCATPEVYSNNLVQLTYEDTCGQLFEDVPEENNTITVNNSVPNISTSTQTPITRTIQAAQTYTWTINVPNTGTGATEKLIITETLQIGWENITTTLGTPAAITYTITENPSGDSTIVWLIDELDSGETWTATFSADAKDAATAYRTTLDVTSACDNGVINYNNPLQNLDKIVSQTPVSIGEPFSYTIKADFFGTRVYTDVLLTDYLPQLDNKLVFSVTDVVIVNENSSTNDWIYGPTSNEVITFTTSGTPSGIVQGADQITITVNGVISNVIEANNNDIFTNTLELSFYEDGQYYRYEDSVDGTIREPVLEINKTASPSSGIQAGDLITYTLIVEHTPQSTATAYNVIVTDSIPTDLTLVAGSLKTDPSASSSVTDSQHITVTYDLFTQASAIFTITYVVEADDSIQPSSQLINNAFVRWTSTADDPVEQERTGDGTGPNDYFDGSQAPVDTSVPTFAKYLLGGNQYTIGDLVTYTAILTIPTGQTRDVIFTDTLPVGLSYINGSSELTGPGIVLPGPSPSVNGPNNGVGTTTLTWSVGDITNPVTSPQQVVVTFTVVVSNTFSNQDGETRDNDMSVGWLNDQGERQIATDPDNPPDEDTFTIIEPDLAIKKSANPESDLILGDYITYTIEVSHTNDSHMDAYDVVITDTIPLCEELISGTIQTSLTPSNLITDSHHITITFDTFALISETVVITYLTQLCEFIPPSTEITNYTRVTWTSQPGTDPNERTGDGEGPNDYNKQDEQEVRAADLETSKQIIEDRVYTIGEAITYTLLVNIPSGIAKDLSISDFADPGLAYISPTSFITLSSPIALPDYSISVPGIGGADFTLHFSDTITNTTGLPTSISLTYRLIVLDDPDNKHGDIKENVSQINYIDSEGNPETQTSDPVDSPIAEPALILEKSVAPEHSSPGDTVQYSIALYHDPAVTPTLTAFNVVLTDVIPTGLNYIPGSWDQVNGPSPNTLDDNNSPLLFAGWDQIPSTYTQSNPIRLRYAAVVDANNPSGIAFTNTVTSTWTSLTDDPYGETRQDYQVNDQAVLALSEVSIAKTAPISVVAGALITYVIGVHNSGPLTATEAVVQDRMPFQVESLTADFFVPGGNSGVCTITPDPIGDLIECSLGDIPFEVTATITVTGMVEPNTPEGADLTNIAEVTITSPDGTITNNTVEVETEVYTLADNEITKVCQPNAIAGETVTCTLVLTNNGPSISRDVDVKDILPTGLNWISGSSSQGACVNGICQLGDMGVNSTISMVITASVDSSITGTLNNQAILFSDTQDPNTANNQDDADIDIDALAALQIEKIDLTDPVYAGNTYLYEIRAQNTGASDAENVTITDTLPAQVSFEGSSPECSHDGSPTGGQVTCTLTVLPSGETNDFLINVRVSSEISEGDIGTNTVVITSTTPIDPAGSQLSDSEDTTYKQISGNPADLALAKTVNPALTTAGNGQFTYTITVTNNGPAPASAVQVVDAYPREFEFISATASDGSVCNSGMTCDLGTMEVDETILITLVVDVPSTAISGTYTNTAYVGSASPDSNPNNNQDIAFSTVDTLANLEIEKLSNPSVAVAGEDLNYTLVITNTGPSLAENVTVSDEFPTDFTPSLIVSSKGGCTQLPCNIGSLDAGENVVIYINGTVSTSASSDLENTASVTSTTPGAGASDQLITPIASFADLSIIKTASATVNAGDTIDYSITVSNLGPSEAVNVLITDTLPDGVSVVTPLPAGCVDNGDRTITCSLASMTEGSSASFSFQVATQSDLPLGTSLENIAQVSSQVQDPNQSNNQSNADTSILASADLAIQKTTIPDPVIAGQNITYTLVVTNYGPSQANQVQLSEYLPNEVSFISATTDQGNCNDTGCLLGTMDPMDVVTITIVGLIDPQTAPETELENLATVFSSIPDPSQNNNTDSCINQISSSAELVIEKISLVNEIAPDGLLVYQVSVVNKGPSVAKNVIVTDTLPSQVVYQNNTDSCVENQPGSLSCSLGSIETGVTEKFLITVRVDSDVISGTMLENTVNLTSTTPLVPSSVLTDTDSTPVVEPELLPADLAINKNVTPSMAIAGQDIITYTLSITNYGPATAINAEVFDTLPTGLSFIQAIASQGFCTGDVLCSIGTMAPNQSELVTITAIVNSNVISGTVIDNTAIIRSSHPDSNPDNNISEKPLDVIGEADIAIQKTNATNPVTAGEQLLYTLQITNYGPSDVQEVIVTDSLPAEVTYIQSTPPENSAPTPVVWNLGSMQAGQVKTIELLVQVGADVSSTFTNTVQVSSNLPDPNPENNTDQEPTDVVLSADLAIVKLGCPCVLLPGDEVTYTLQIHNYGPSNAYSVIVTDTLPDELNLIRVSEPQESGPNPIVWNIGELSVGETHLITIVSEVKLWATSSFENVAQVGSTTPDPVPSNNQDSNITEIDYNADLSVQKTDLPDPALLESELYYLITVTNHGPSQADEVVLVDSLPQGVSFVRANPPPDEQPNPSTLKWNLGSLIPDETRQFTITTFVESWAEHILTNTVAVNSTTPDPNTSNNQDSEVTIAGIPTGVMVNRFLAQLLDPWTAVIEWSTTSEQGNAGFEIFRASSNDFESAEMVYAVEAAGTGLAGSQYQFEDTIAGNGQWWYWLIQISDNNESVTYGPIRVTRFKIMLPLIINQWSLNR